jgi:hypothetical protein
VEIHVQAEAAMPNRKLMDDPEFWLSRAEEVRAFVWEMKRPPQQGHYGQDRRRL